jgi:hypothetical protein
MHEGSPGAFEQLHLCGMSRRGYLGLMDGVTKALGTILEHPVTVDWHQSRQPGSS